MDERYRKDKLQIEEEARLAAAKAYQGQKSITKVFL